MLFTERCADASNWLTGACSQADTFECICIARQRDMSINRSIMRMVSLGHSLLCQRVWNTIFLFCTLSPLFLGYTEQFFSPIPFTPFFQRVWNSIFLFCTLSPLFHGYTEHFFSFIPLTPFFQRVWRIISPFYTLTSAFRWVWRTISCLYTLLIYGYRNFYILINSYLLISFILTQPHNSNKGLFFYQHFNFLYFYTTPSSSICLVSGISSFFPCPGRMHHLVC